MSIAEYSVGGRRAANLTVPREPICNRSGTTDKTAMAVQVMIVDDSASSRILIRHHLEGLGCRVVGEAENPREALRLYDALSAFESQKPNLVTLDLVMDHVDGIDALTAFRELRRKDPAIPILIISA